MDIEFLGQPFAADRRLGVLLEEILPSTRSLWALIAWAQLSGLRLMEPHLRRLRERGATSEVLLGIDGGIATQEALALAIELFDSVTLFHDPGSRVYHPKIYALESADEVVVVVGSSNLTEGGLYRNYEGNLLLRLRRGEPADDKLYADLSAFRDQLRSPEMPCRRLTRELLAELTRAGSLLRTETERAEAERRRRETVSRVVETIFGSPRIRLPSSPGASRIAESARVPARPSGVPRAVVERVPLVWWKRLTRSDAIRKEETSHQRNYVILGKAGHDIDQKTWFRSKFFDRVSWRSERMRTGKTKEVADVPFDVIVDAENLGTYQVRVEHARNRIANQNNSPTWLHWSTLVNVIQRRDYTDWYLVLEKLDAFYRLRLSPVRPQGRA